ncbi:MAG: short-chain dehydrogenase [Leptothrix sp. (in: Bacteria)]|nr:short-chain dehydrogenase [Leptothrix sp. (in: b-proteobacteria)]
MNRVVNLRQQAGPPPDTRWRVARLLTAPHRLGFFAAALMLAASALWWAVALFARQLGLAVPWAVPPPVAHALLMTAGFMPLFIVGFLFTAGPRWLGLPEVSAHTLKWPVSAMLGGWALALPGFHLQPLLAGLGVAAVATGWSVVAGRFVVLCRRSTAADRLHAGGVAAAGAIGALALWGAAAGLLAGDSTWVRVATQVALWAWLAPTFAAVSHRMIPFFTASALPMLDSWRPNWLLGVMAAVLATSAAGVVAELLWWPLPAPVHGVLAAVQAPAAALMLWLVWRWGLVQSLKIRLLAMLHGGFVWLGVALALAALSHTQQALGHAGLGLAPTHALAMGYLGATLLAMITRVAAGHSGRPLAADNLAWGLYWAVQGATLLRVGATLWPAADATLLLGAVFGWAVAAVGWAWRYGGWLGRPRVDGRPG